MSISIKIDVKKIDKDSLFKGAKGTYLDCILKEHKSEWDDGFVVQSLSKERRAKGEKGPLIGSWKHLAAPAERKPQPAPDDDLPFD